MREMHFFLLILFVAGSSCHATAQRPHFGLWTTVNVPVNFSKKLQWHNDAGYRTLGSSVIPMQYLYRPGIRYLVNAKFNAAAGIAFFFTKTDFNKQHHEFGKEFRLWQEGVYQQTTYNWQWQIRLRSEQRFFDATSVKSAYTAYRYRIRGGLTRTVNNNLSIQLANEYMRQYKNKQSLFDQNRVMVTGLYQLNRTTQLQAGYMWLRWPDESQHIISVGITKKISLHGENSNR